MLTLILRRRLSLTALFAALLPSVTASAAEPPTAPSELYIWIINHDPYGISLIWRDNSENEQGFEIFTRYSMVSKLAGSERIPTTSTTTTGGEG